MQSAAAIISLFSGLQPLTRSNVISAMAHKVIISRQHLDAFLSSPTHADVVAFIEQLNSAVIGKTLRSECYVGPVS